MLAVTLQDFLSSEDLSSSVVVLSLIAVCLFFIVGWCFFDVLWRVFFSRIKVVVLLCCISLVMRADWSNDDINRIVNDVQGIRSNTNQSNTLLNDIEDRSYDFMQGLYLATHTTKPIDSGNKPFFFGELLYGTSFKKIKGTENPLGYEPNYPSQYKFLFGLKDYYYEQTPFYLSLLRQSMSTSAPITMFDMDRFNNDQNQTAVVPDNFLSQPNASDWLNKTDSGFVQDGYIGSSRDQYIKTKINDESIQERQAITTTQRWIAAAVNHQGVFENLTGEVFSFNFGWLADYGQSINLALSSVNSMTGEVHYLLPANFMQSWREFSFSLKLVPAQGDLLYPLWSKYREFDSVIIPAFYVLCYGTIIIFIGSKVKALVEGA